MSLDLDPSLLEEFVLESSTSLRDIEQDLLRLEDAGGDPELINRIFRAVHTIKGTGGYLHLTTLTDVAHLGETLLDQLRKQQRQVTGEVVDVLLDTIDSLRAMVDSDDHGTSADTGPLLARLRDLVGVKETSPAGGGAEEDGTRFHKLDLDDAVFTDIQASLALGSYLYWIRLRPEHLEECAEFSQGVQAGFETLGSIIYVSDPAVLEQPPADGLLLVFATALDDEMMRMTFPFEPNDFGSISAEMLEHRLDPGPDIAPLQAALPSVATPSCAMPISGDSPMTAPAAGRKQKAATSESQMMKIDARFLDELLRLTGNMVMARNQMLTRFSFGDDTAFKTLSRAITEVHRSVVQTRMQTVGEMFDRFRRVVRDLARQLDKTIELKTEGGDLELDRTILEAFFDPMTHMVRNCIDHAIEPAKEREATGKPIFGTITLRAYQESGEIIIEIEDDGRGIDAKRVRQKAIDQGILSKGAAQDLSDADAVNLIFQAGFSTAEAVSDISGRGVGMDVVRTNIERIGGTVDCTTQVGRGTTMSARLPLTKAMVASSLISGLIVRLGAHRFVIPQSAVNELIRVPPRVRREQIKVLQGQRVFQHRELVLPIINLEEALGLVGDSRFELHPSHLDLDEEEVSAGGDVVEEPSPDSDGTAPTPPKNETVREQLDGAQTLIVLQHRQHLFGVLVDQIIGIEEAVVRDMPSLVAGASVFSGHTVLGDGRVIMLVDINGLVERLNMRFLTRPQHHTAENAPIALSVGRRSDRQTMIVFNYAEDEHFAVPLELVSLVEKIPASKIRRVGDRAFYPFKDQTIPLLYMHKHLPITPIDEDLEHFNLIMPARMNFPIGLLTNNKIHVAEVKETFDSKITHEKGILGTFMQEDKLVMLLDLYALFEHDDPEHFDTAAGRHGDQPARILLAEDSLFYRRLNVTYLTSPGRELVVAKDGREALDILLADPKGFDLLVSDIEMPRMNGFELIEAIRSDPRLQDLPVIALTAISDAASRQRGLRLGFNEYVFKVDKDALLRFVSQYSTVRRNAGGSLPELAAP